MMCKNSGNIDIYGCLVLTKNGSSITRKKCSATTKHFLKVRLKCASQCSAFVFEISRQTGYLL